MTDIIAAFEELADDSLPQEFASYFEVPHIGAERSRGTRRCRVDPVIPVDVWNISERASTGMTRTNDNMRDFVMLYKVRFHASIQISGN